MELELRHELVLVTVLEPSPVPWKTTTDTPSRVYWEERERDSLNEPERECSKCGWVFPKMSFWERVGTKTVIHKQCDNCRSGELEE